VAEDVLIEVDGTILERVAELCVDAKIGWKPSISSVPIRMKVPNADTEDKTWSGQGIGDAG